MKRTILAAASAAALTIALAAPAHANTGVVHAGEFWDDIAGMRQTAVQNQWGVTGNIGASGNGWRDVTYDSAGDFTRDICWVIVHYELGSDGYYHARNYANGDGGKGQVACPGNPYNNGSFWYPVGATHA